MGSIQSDGVSMIEKERCNHTAYDDHKFGIAIIRIWSGPLEGPFLLVS